MARIATIVLTVVFHFALGAIYFSPEYGVARAWIAANDVDPKVMEASQFPVKPFATAFVSAVAYAFAVALVFGRSYSRLEATLHVFVFWVALHVLPTFTNVMFVGTEKGHQRYALDVFYLLIQCALSCIPAIVFEPFAKAKTN